MTVYAHVQNKIVVGVYDLLPTTWNGVENFNQITSTETLLQHGLYKIVKFDEVYNSETHTLENPLYYYDESTNQVYERFDIVKKPEPLVDVNSNPQAKPTILTLQEFRAKRDQLLQESDWTNLVDVRDSMDPLKVQAWKDYRMHLRNMPDIYKYGMLIEDDGNLWPQPPV